MATKLQFFETNNAGRSFGNQAGTAKLSQGFKHTAVVSIEKVSVLLYKLGSPADNVTLEIQQDDGTGLPNGAIIAGGTANPVAMTGITTNSAGAWYDFTFPSPPALQANIQYHIVAGRSGSLNNGNNPVWKIQTTGGYADGELGRYDSGTSSWIVYGGDGNFQLWGDPIAFEDLKAEIKALGLALEDLKIFASAEYATAWEFLKTAIQTIALRQEDLQVSVSALSEYPTAYEFLKANARAVVRILEDLKVHVQATAAAREDFKANIQSRDGYPPRLVRYPTPRNGLTNVPVDGAVRFYLRDQHAGVDMSKVWVEIDGVKYNVNSSGFGYTGNQWEYCVNVKPQTNWGHEQTVNVKIFAEDLAGNPGLLLE